MPLSESSGSAFRPSPPGGNHDGTVSTSSGSLLVSIWINYVCRRGFTLPVNSIKTAHKAVHIIIACLFCSFFSLTWDVPSRGIISWHFQKATIAFKATESNTAGNQPLNPMLSTLACSLLMELCLDKISLASIQNILKSTIQLRHITYWISCLSYHSIQQDFENALLKAKAHCTLQHCAKEQTRSGFVLFMTILNSRFSVSWMFTIFTPP